MKKYFKRFVIISMSLLMIISMLPGLFSTAAQTVVELKMPVKPAYSDVSIVQSSKSASKSLTYTDIKKLVWDAIDQAGGFKGLIKNKTNVSLKVNLVNNTGYNPYQKLPVTLNGVTTDWRVAKAVAEKVRVYNPHGKVYIIEGSYADTPTMFKTLGYTKANIPQVDGFIALEKVSGGSYDNTSDKLVKVHYPGHLSNNNLFVGTEDEDYFFFNKQYYYDSDFLISVPVLKNHWDALVTGGIKNLSIGGTPKSTYPNRGDMATHTTSGQPASMDLRNWIHDYYLCRPADFVVIDGLQGSQFGPTPNSGEDVLKNGRVDGNIWADYQMNMRTIIAGKDGVATDTIEGLVTNANVDDAIYLKALEDSGVGNFDIRKIRVVGKQVDEVRKTFKFAPGYTPGKLLTSTDLAPVTVTITKLTETTKNINVSLALSANVVKVEFLIDGKKFGNPISQNMSEIALSIPKLAVGKHTLTVNAFGQYLSRASASKSLVSTAIKASIKSITESNNNLKIALTTSKAVKKVSFLMDGKKYGISVTNGFTSITLPVAKITPGKHTLTMNAYNQYLVLATASKSFTKKAAVRKLSYGEYEAPLVSTLPVIDGSSSDPAWSTASWSYMNTNWLGAHKAPTDASDFSGKFKFLWAGSKLYFLAEITDDVLMKSPNADPTVNYPSYDCLEIFVDENKSGGEHTFNYNAFAYHLTLSGHAIDYGTTPDYKGLIFDKNATYTWNSIGSNKYIWEGAITIYDDTFDLNKTTNVPVTLTTGKVMGVSVAYCDNDGDADAAKPDRDHFMASNNIPASLGGNYSNTGWQNASAFGTLFLLP